MTTWLSAGRLADQELVLAVVVGIATAATRVVGWAIVVALTAVSFTVAAGVALALELKAVFMSLTI